MHGSGASAMNYAVGGMSASTIGRGVETPKLPLLDETRGSLESALKELHELIEQVRTFNDGVHGSQPSGALTGAANEPIGRADALRSQLGWLHGSLATLRNEVNRLGAI